MFISRKFHSGIEPLFLTTFPHKTTLFCLNWVLGTRLCLIYISPSSSFSFSHSFRSVSIFALREATSFNNTSTQNNRSEDRSGHPFYSKSTPSVVNRKHPFLLTKQHNFTLGPLSPTTPFGESLKVKKGTFS